MNIDSLLVCPNCHGILDNLTCHKCSITFEYKDGVYDFLLPDDRINAVLKTLIKFGAPALMSPTKYAVNRWPYHQDANYDDDTIRVCAAFSNILHEYLYPIWGGNNYVIDIGCGNGWLAYLLARHNKVIAIEINPYTLPSIAPDVGCGIIGICADGEKLPLADNSISAIVGNSTYHHMFNKLVALNEWYRVLERGGIILFTGEKPWKVPEGEEALDMWEKGEYGFTEEEMQSTFKECAFNNITFHGIVYREHMQWMDTTQLLVAADEEIHNGFIYAVKESMGAGELFEQVS